MSKTKQIFRPWLPLALVPMMSVAVLAGCSSDDNSDDGDGDDTPAMVVGDGDGNGVPDAFQADVTGGTDSNGVGIDDIYATTDTGADTNNNGVDDSFEAFLTGGTDANADGVDDEAAAALVVDGGDGGTDGGDGGTDGGDGGTDGGDGGTDGGDGGTDGGDGGTDANSLGALILGNTDSPQGAVDMSWDGSNLSGTVTTNDDVGAVQAYLYSGIAASNDPGTSLLQLSGSAPNFSYPNGLSADQTAPITAAMASGNLFIQVDKADGSTVRSEQMLPPGGAVIATYTPLVSNDSTVFSNGAAYMNVNINTGDFSAYLNVNLNPEDTDANGDAITLAAAHIHQDSIAGAVMAPLVDTGDSIAFKATGQFTPEQLDIVNNNNAWYNVHQNDGTTPGASFLAGQIQLP